MLSRKKEEHKKLVAVVVPLSTRNTFLPEEEISLRHIQRFLDRYDKYFVIPEGLDISYPGFQTRCFNRRYFGSVAANTKLMLSAKFYESFKDYRYLLLHHLDSLVFSDQLAQWCNEDYDYIGSPWIEFEGEAYSELQRNKVGNGGLSLRKIESFLDVFYSKQYWEDPSRSWQSLRSAHSIVGSFVRLPRVILKYMRFSNNARSEMAHYPWNEDIFWANRAAHYYPEFKIAPVDAALRFAFECHPRRCFERNESRVPFGCHAWQKYDREFWEPYILQ